MFILYDTIFILFSLVYLPTFIFKLRQAESWQELVRERFGYFSPSFLHVVKRKPVIWIHAVSVGEVLGIREFYKQMVANYPMHHVLISTTTPTGQKVAQEIAPGKAFYFPFDISWVTKRVVKKLQPSAIILMETELWPNLILQARRRRVPVCVVNGRLSPRSFRSYYRVKWLIRNIVKHVEFFSAQTPRYEKRLKKLGVEPSRVLVTGNMKFDNINLQSLPQELAQRLRANLGFGTFDQIIVAGSTHPLEEDLILEAFVRLKKVHSHLKLLIAPRHVERADEVVDLAEHYGLTVLLKTEIEKERQPRFDVLVLNTIGELAAIYAISNFVVMGGGFIKHGGQSPIEPAAQKKPILFGPHIFNFTEIYNLLEKEGGALRVSRSLHLYHALDFLLTSQPDASEMGEKAFRLIQAQQGAVVKNIHRIDQLLQSERLYHVLPS
jgi:3-deoxy-D-manno-octulosonic-acid transferase